MIKNISKIKFWAMVGALLLFIWVLIPSSDPAPSPFKDQNIVEKQQNSTVNSSIQRQEEAMQELIDSGAVPALANLKSDKAKARDAALIAPPSADEPKPLNFPTQKIQFKTARGLLPLMAGITTNEIEREQGMMYFRQWPQTMHGLLFAFRDPMVVNMWMKNTYLSLDILFMDAEGTIVTIEESARPLSEDSISSRVPALYAFEIPAGAAREWHLEVGDKLIYTPAE